MTKKLTFLFVLTMVLLTACGQSAAPAATPTTAPQSTPVTTGGEVKIDIQNFKFSPDTVTIKVGQTVTWTNQDSATHSVVALDGSWKSESLGNGAIYSRTFDTAGTFEYRCGFHANMLGKIIVEP
jgi:plastocyanin